MDLDTDLFEGVELEEDHIILEEEVGQYVCCLCSVEACDVQGQDSMWQMQFQDCTFDAAPLKCDFWQSQ